MDELQTVKLRTKKRVYVLIGIYLLTMTILVASLLIQESKPQIWICFVLLVGSSLLVFSSVLTDQPSLKLTLKGLESRMLFVTRKVQWLDIAEITESMVRNIFEKVEATYKL